MRITDEAVSTATRAILEADMSLSARQVAHVALEAAAPYMQAAAWDEGVQAQKDWTWNDDMDPLSNPYRK